MPPTPLYDLSRLDLNHREFELDEIRRLNPQRYEFEQLTAITKWLPEEGLIVGYLDLRGNEFWVRGHMPGRPLLPGVLMLEAAAQLCSFYYGKTFQHSKLLGLGKITDASFRESVKPRDRLWLIAKAKKLSRRISVFATQGLVERRVVFEAEITGVML
jgi:3-hydroxyacyl-[acyl-carrier-protein] dehydratase